MNQLTNQLTYLIYLSPSTMVVKELTSIIINPHVGFELNHPKTVAAHDPGMNSGIRVTNMTCSAYEEEVSKIKAASESASVRG